MIRGVIFDLDDTLYDYKSVNKIAVKALCEYTCNVLNITEGQFYDAFAKGKLLTKEMLANTAAEHNRMLYCQKTLEVLGVKPALHALDMYEVYWQTMLEHMVLNDGVKELFDLLQSKNIKIAICTDLTAHIQHRKIRKLGLAKLIDCIVTSEEAGEEKPGARMFELCLQKLGLPAAETCYVGDSFEKDIVGASKAGIRPVWYTKEDDFVTDNVTGYLRIQCFDQFKAVL